MSGHELADIFARLSDQDQEDALLRSLELLFARSEWGVAEEFIKLVMSLPGHDNLRLNALALGIRTALRLEKTEAAFERFELLLAQAGQGGDLAAEAILQLAEALLPARADKLVAIWDACAVMPMRKDARQAWRKAGHLLAQACAGNRNEAEAARIRALLAASHDRLKRA